MSVQEECDLVNNSSCKSLQDQSADDGLKAMAKMKYFNDITLILFICVIIMMVVYLVPQQALETAKAPGFIRTLNKNAMPLISFLIIILISTTSLRFTYAHIVERLRDPCDAYPPLRINPSNRAYACSSFVYCCLIGYVRILLYLCMCLLALYVVFLLVNNCIVYHDKQVLRMWSHPILRIIWWILIIPPLIRGYHKFMDWILHAIGLAHVDKVAQFFKATNILQASNLFTQKGHETVLIIALSFAAIFGMFFINTANIESMCQEKKEEERRYEVFRNRTHVGFMIVMTIIVFMYIGLWLKETFFTLIRSE